MTERGSITNYAAQEFLESNEFDLSAATILPEGATLEVRGPVRLTVMSGEQTPDGLDHVLRDLGRALAAHRSRARRS